MATETLLRKSETSVVTDWSTDNLSSENQWSLVRSAPPAQTEMGSTQVGPAASVVATGFERPENRTHGSSRLSAVVSDVGLDFIRMTCRTENGEVAIDIPTDSVPDALRKFGQAVYIELNRSMPYRRFAIRERQATNPEARTLDELRGQLERL